MAHEARYVCLQETSEEECETWMTFLKYDGNEAAIKHLSDQIESVNFYLMPGCSTFDIDIEHLVSATTAKQVTKLELNSHMWHRKFDGKLEMIDFNFDKVERKCAKKKRDAEYCNEKKMDRVYDLLGEGGIDKFIDEEDIDPEDRANRNESDSNSDSNHDSNSDSDNSSESDAKDKSPPKKVKAIPVAVASSSIPRNKQAKRDKAKEHRQRTQTKDDD